MAIDPSIYAQFAERPVAPVNPFERMTEIATLKAKQATAEQEQADARRKAEADTAVREVLARHPGDFDAAAQELTQSGLGPEALALGEKYYTLQKQIADSLTAQASTVKAQIDPWYRRLMAATPENWSRERQAAVAVAPWLDGFLPAEFDPRARDEAVGGLARTINETLDAHEKIADNLLSGKYQEALAKSLLLAQTPEQYQQTLALAKASGMPQAVLEAMPAFGPDGKAQLQMMSGQADEPLVPTVGPNGKPIYTPRSQAAGMAVPPSQGATAPVAVLGPDGQPVYVTPQQAIGRQPASASSAQGLTPEGVAFAATQYRLTRVMPPMGMGSSGARTAIINEAARQSAALKQSPAEAVQRQSAFKADESSLTKLRNMQTSAEAYETKAFLQADLIAQLNPKVGRTHYPVINQALLAGKARIAGDQDTQLLYNAILTFTNEYAKILEGATGSVAAASESARKQAASLVSASLNQGTLTATIEQMKKEMQYTMDGYDAAIEHITTRMGGQLPPPTTTPKESKTVSEAELSAIAKRRGTTVEEERQRATAAGYVIR